MDTSNTKTVDGTTTNDPSKETTTTPFMGVVNAVTKQMNTKQREVNIERKPAVNLLSQDAFKERAELVFSIMDDILGKSYGPYGAATLISNYPYVYATKDGYRIANQISFDPVAGSPIDRIIAQMAMDICGRLNYAVGDGTTTAILATNKLFYRVNKIMPENYSAKEFIDVMQSVKERIIQKLESYATPITKDNIGDAIRKITMIASNGDTVISNMITQVYEKYEYPILRCDTTDGPDTYLDISEGYKCKVRLGDELYVNTERRTGEYSRPYVLIFDHQIRMVTYKEIIEPIYAFCRHNGMSLLVIAPSYDEETLTNHIRRDIMAEYRGDHKTSLIITAYPKNNEADVKSIHDLAVLVNTVVIDRTIEGEILGKLDKVSKEYEPLSEILYIPGTKATKAMPGAAMSRSVEMQVAEADGCLSADRVNLNPTYLLSVGRADTYVGGEKESVFTVSGYDENLYQKMLDEAKHILDDTIKKYEMLGTYTDDVYAAQYRYVSLLMKTAVIYVGGDSEMSRGMRADAIEDAIRAAESAFRYGYILGGSISTIKAAREIEFYTYDVSDLEKKIASAIELAFVDVYERVFDNCPKTDMPMVEEAVTVGVSKNKVYDVTAGVYTSDIINSTKTDIEVLTATVDLLSILMTGNQMLVARYQHETPKGA